MGNKAKSKSTPLPSVLSSIRRAGAIVTSELVRTPDHNAASTAEERESFISAISTADGPIPIPQHLQSQQHHRKFRAPFELTASGDFGFRGKDKKDAAGKKFRVQIPQKMLFYVFLVFFAIPILCAIFVLFRKIIGNESNGNDHHLSHRVVEKMAQEEQAPLILEETGGEGLNAGGVEMDPNLLSRESHSQDPAVDEIMPVNEVGEEQNDQVKDGDEENLSPISNSPNADENEMKDNTLAITNEDMEDALGEGEEEKDVNENHQTNEEGNIDKEENDGMSNPSLLHEAQDSPDNENDNVDGEKGVAVATTAENGSGTLEVAVNEEEDEKERRRMLSSIEKNDGDFETGIEQKWGGNDRPRLLRGGYLNHR